MTAMVALLPARRSVVKTPRAGNRFLDLVDVPDLPDHTAPLAAHGSMQWGDALARESVIGCRLAAAGVDHVEVPSVSAEWRRDRALGAQRRATATLQPAALPSWERVAA